MVQLVQDFKTQINEKMPSEDLLQRRVIKQSACTASLLSCSAQVYIVSHFICL